MPLPTFRHPLQAFGLALLAEAALLLGAGAMLAGAAQVAPAPAISEPVAITLLSEPAAPPPLPKPPPPEPVRKLQNKPENKPMRMAPPVAPQAAAPAPVAPATPLPVAAMPTAFSEPVPVASAPPPAAPAARTDPGADYVAKVRAAVQAAVFYPPAAAALRYSGRVRVEFHLRDGTPGAARVVQASGIGIIDRAALESIQNARYPEAPAEIRGSDHVYLVWVEFTR